MDSTLMLVSLLHTLTKLNVGNRQRKERNRYSDPKHILHKLVSRKQTVIGPKRGIVMAGSRLAGTPEKFIPEAVRSLIRTIHDLIVQAEAIFYGMLARRYIRCHP